MNINRDYLIINDVKKSNVQLSNNNIFFYITDKNTQNIFVNLVINVSDSNLITKYANIENAEDYTLTMNIVKPDNTSKIIDAKLHSKEEAIFEFDLPEECCDVVGTYKCELLTKCVIDGHDEITTSNKLTYKVKSSVLNDLDNIVNAPEYPIVIQLFDKLSDINQYEEDRRANELARQLAEEQRQARFDALDADMEDSIQAMDDKVVDVENRVSTKEQAVDTLIVDTKADIDEYKVAKDAEIDEYKATKDTEINNAITAQDNKIDEAISNQNDRIAVVENNVVVQNSRLDVLENKDTLHESRLDAIEAKNVEQDNRLNAIEAIDVAQNTRLDAIEIKNQQQDDRLLDAEKVNKRQDMDLKCLFAESKNNMIDVTEEGNSIHLQNSTVGYTLIDEIQGNTMVNCNKEPDKEIILNGNINTQGYSNVTLTEGVDGGLVDVALEGNTMVNVCNQKDSVALPFNRELTYLYANTLYAVQFVSDAVSKVDITLGGAELLNQDVVLGINKYTITTPSNLTDNNLVLNGEGFNASNIVVTEATDQDFGYFEGMKSVGECEGNIKIVSQNKNLVDMSNFKPLINNAVEVTMDKDNIITLKGKINSTSEASTIPRATNIKVFLEKGKTYIASFETDGDYGSLHNTDTVEMFWMLNGLAREFFNINAKQQSFTVSTSGWYYARIDVNKGDATHKFWNIRIEEGSTATDYIPHQSNKQQLTHEPLRAVGEIKDKYVLIDGKWYIERNTNQKIIDGTEKGWEVRTDANGKNTFILYHDHFQDCASRDNSYVSDLFKVSVEGGLIKEENSMRIAEYGGKPRLFLVPPKDYYSSLDLFKQYMSQNPTNIIYGLSTPTYEPIDYNPFEVYSDITHISNNSTIPCNMTIKNTGYNCLLKPSTTYTVSSNLGLNTVTTPSTLTEDCLRFMDTDTSSVTTMKNVTVLEGDYTNGKPLPSHFSGIESAFEQEYDEAVGKYKVKARVQNEDASKENYIEFYINEPLRGVGDVKDKIYVKNDKVVVERNCGIRPYQDGDFGTYPTDKVNTVYQLAEPVYEEIEYNDTKLFIESFKNSTLFYNSNVPVTSTVHYSYSVPIVDTVAQTANVTDQQDSMIIDLATQVAVMEMMLM